MRKNICEGRTSSRLQRQAPPALQLEAISPRNNNNTSDNNPFGNSPATAIPLLSPLIIEPVLSPDIDDRSVHDGGAGDDQKWVVAPAGQGWQHPAVVSTDPSSLFSFFQSQCAGR
ncbi:hypothetical protein Droror1_Dr00019117 [Drosera rotundifolia]